MFIVAAGGPASQTQLRGRDCEGGFVRAIPSFRPKDGREDGIARRVLLQVANDLGAAAGFERGCVLVLIHEEELAVAEALGLAFLS